MRDYIRAHEVLIKHILARKNLTILGNSILQKEQKASLKILIIVI